MRVRVGGSKAFERVARTTHTSTRMKERKTEKGRYFKQHRHPATRAEADVSVQRDLILVAGHSM